MNNTSQEASMHEYEHKVTASLVHERAGRYAKQMISHWKGKAERLETTDSTSTLYFSAEDPKNASSARFEVLQDRVIMTIASPSRDWAIGVAEVIEEHLHRFAGKRDVLEITWE